MLRRLCSRAPRITIVLLSMPGMPALVPPRRAKPVVYGCLLAWGSLDSPRSGADQPRISGQPPTNGDAGSQDHNQRGNSDLRNASRRRQECCAKMPKSAPWGSFDERGDLAAQEPAQPSMVQAVDAGAGDQSGHCHRYQRHHCPCACPAPRAPFPLSCFWILSTGTNTFTVPTGTTFFVPIAFVDDSPPIFGDFPADSSAVKAYFFGPDQVGAHDLAIEVDGVSTAIGPDYLAGPVLASGLLDGGGSHLIQIGVFLTPLSKGSHTITIRGTLDGAIAELFTCKKIGARLR